MTCPFIMEHNPYRNTGQLRDEFRASLQSAKPNSIKLTNKIDGSCYYLDENGIWYGRLDIKAAKGAQYQFFWDAKRAGSLSQEDFDLMLKLKRERPTQKDLESTNKNVRIKAQAKLVQAEKMEQWTPSGPPDLKTGHWTGWLPITSDLNQFKWAQSAIDQQHFYPKELELGTTYELIGNKMQGNPYGLKTQVMVRHGSIEFKNLTVDDFASHETIFKIFESDSELLGSEGVVIWIDGSPAWKIHHGHIGSYDKHEENDWKKAPFIPEELKIYQ